LDTAGLYGNNKTFFIPSADFYLLALLNSPLLWWHNWRYLPHMKDEALSPVAFLMEKLPIAEPPPRLRKEIEVATAKVVDLTGQQRTIRRQIIDWLRVEFDVEKPSNKLQSPIELDADAFVAEVKKARGRKNMLTAAGLASLRDEYRRTIEPARALAAESLALERQVSDLVNEAYGLTPEEVALMWETAPPRMPLANPFKAGADA
jgi:hypothetical protein